MPEPPISVRMVMAENTKSLTLIVKPSEMTGALFEAYARHFEANIVAYEFTFNGARMNAKSTIQDAGLKNGDILEVSPVPPQGIIYEPSDYRVISHDAS